GGRSRWARSGQGSASWCWSRRGCRASGSCTGSSRSEHCPSRLRCSARARSSAPSGPSDAVVTVLVVDDDPPIRRMLERTLGAEEYVVRTAADGGAALAAVERSAPDVIVLDVKLPGLDGPPVCRRLRRAGLALPILLLTARDAVHDRVEGLDAGADDYLVKPFAPEELLARVRALLRRGNEPEALLAYDDLVFDVRLRS